MRDFDGGRWCGKRKNEWVGEGRWRRKKGRERREKK